MLDHLAIKKQPNVPSCWSWMVQRKKLSKVVACPSGMRSGKCAVVGGLHLRSSQYLSSPIHLSIQGISSPPVPPLHRATLAGLPSIHWPVHAHPVLSIGSMLHPRVLLSVLCLIQSTVARAFHTVVMKPSSLVSPVEHAPIDVPSDGAPCPSALHRTAPLSLDSTSDGAPRLRFSSDGAPRLRCLRRGPERGGVAGLDPVGRG